MISLVEGIDIRTTALIVAPSARPLVAGIALIALIVTISVRKICAIREGYARNAAYHAREERKERGRLAELAQQKKEGMGGPGFLLLEHLSACRAEYHEKMKVAYTRAVLNPYNCGGPGRSR